MEKVSFNKDSKVLILSDNIKAQYFLVFFILILNFFNAALNLFNARNEAFGLLEYTWIFIGIFSVLTLVLFFIKNTLSNKIKLDDIEKLVSEKPKGSYYLILKNGKKRKLFFTDKEEKKEQIYRILIGYKIPSAD